MDFKTPTTSTLTESDASPRTGSPWRDAWRALRQPVPASTQHALARAAERVPGELVHPRQYLGRQYAGCGATIGATPRCDFACRGCYLGEQANRIPSLTVAEIRAQLDRMREWLGDGGNVQITDGEVTLRDEAELISIIRHACDIGLVPMLMTHGDAFRRDPGLLARLMVEGGLCEVSIHIDTTQRGRAGAEYRFARDEEDLNPLRNEFAELVRRVRRETGRPLKVASTITVTEESLAGVPAVVDGLARNADVFSIISFLPVAQVGRTEGGMGGGVSVEELWGKIAEGLHGDASHVDRLLRDQSWFGHPGCNRFVQGMVVREGERPVFEPLFRADTADEDFASAWADRYGGGQFRGDGRLEAVGRALGMIAGAPVLTLGRGTAFGLRLLRRLARAAGRGTVPFAWTLLRGRARANYVNVVTHHFMSAAELSTDVGQERVDLCVFKVPVGGRMVSMCEFNSLGGRDQFYSEIELAAREHAS